MSFTGRDLPTNRIATWYGDLRQRWSVSSASIERAVARTPLAQWRRWLGLSPQIEPEEHPLRPASDAVLPSPPIPPGAFHVPRSAAVIPGHPSWATWSPTRSPSPLHSEAHQQSLTDAQAVAQERGLLAVLRTVEETVGLSQVAALAMMGELTRAWPQEPRRIKQWLTDLAQCAPLWSAVKWPEDYPDDLWTAALAAPPQGSAKGAHTSGDRSRARSQGNSAGAGASTHAAEVFPLPVMGPSLVEIPHAPVVLWEAWLAHARRNHFAPFKRAEVRAALRAHPSVGDRVLTAVWDELVKGMIEKAPGVMQWHSWTHAVWVLLSLFDDTEEECRQMVAVLGADRFTRLGPLFQRLHAPSSSGQGRRDLTEQEHRFLGGVLSAIEDPTEAAKMWHAVAKSAGGDIITPLAHLPDTHLAALGLSRFDVRQLLRHRDREIRVIAMRLLALGDALTTPSQAPSRARSRPYEVGPPDAPAAHHPAIARYLARAKAEGSWPQQG